MADTSSLCQCGRGFLNNGDPKRTYCEKPCERKVDKKFVLCRPCAKDWHASSCEANIREPLWHLMRTCARCGHPSADHPETKDWVDMTPQEQLAWLRSG